MLSLKAHISVTKVRVILLELETLYKSAKRLSETLIFTDLDGIVSSEIFIRHSCGVVRSKDLRVR